MFGNETWSGEVDSHFPFLLRHALYSTSLGCEQKAVFTSAMFGVGSCLIHNTLFGYTIVVAFVAKYRGRSRNSVSADQQHREIEFGDSALIEVWRDLENEETNGTLCCVSSGIRRPIFGTPIRLYFLSTLNYMHISNARQWSSASHTVVRTV